MHRLFILLLAMVVCARPVFAGDSVISLDDSRAYLISGELQQLMEIDLQRKTRSAIDLSASIKEPLEGVALTNAGFVLCATKTAVWAYDPKKAQCVKVCDGPENNQIQDISYDPRTQTILIVADFPNNSSLFCRLPQEDRWYHVGDRYDTHPWMPAFSSDGALFCVSKGDLWVGYLHWEQDDNSEAPSEPNKRTYFEGNRCLPLAITPVGNFNSWWVGFHRIAVTQHAVYGHYSRMGGSGISSVIRAKRPSWLALSVTKNKEGEEVVDIYSPGGGSPEGRAAFWQGLRTMVNSVEELADTRCSSLCASRDGRLVLYAGPDLSKVYLIKDDKKPEAVKLTPLAH